MRKLNVAFWDYDRTRALTGGKVKIAGADATFSSAPIVTVILEGVVNGKFNVSELGDDLFLEDFQGWRVAIYRDPGVSEQQAKPATAPGTSIHHVTTAEEARSSCRAAGSGCPNAGGCLAGSKRGHHYPPPLGRRSCRGDAACM